MTKQEKQYVIQRYLHDTKKTDFETHELVEYAKKLGFKVPPPISGEAQLAKAFSQVLREETRQDGKTGRPYRVFHAFMGDGQGQMFWFDIDDQRVTRKKMHKSAFMRREQVVGDMVQLYLDLEHWNRIHANEEPIVLKTDTTEDVNERLSGSDGEAAAA